MDIKIDGKNIEYDCFCYLEVDHRHNIYPVKDAERHLGNILSLQQGDVLFFKNLGHLQVLDLTVQDYDWQSSTTEYLYQDIVIVTRIINY